MPDQSNPFVLIAGGGPTGLTAALELRRFGIPVRIIDEKEGPDSTSRAVGIQARTLEEFQLRGLADDLTRLGHHATGGDIYGNEKPRPCRLHKNPKLLRTTCSSSRKMKPIALLREALQSEGAAIEWGVAKLIAFGQDSWGSLRPSSTTMAPWKNCAPLT